MNLRTLKRFLTVADLGSLSKAAAHLSVSQPSLTKDVQELEDRLGIALFVRTARGMTLTPAGQTIHLRAKLVDAELRKLEADAISLRDGSLGEITIGVVPGFLQNQVLPTATLNLARRASGLTVNYRFGHRSTLLQPLLHGDLDFAIVNIEEDEYADRLVSVPLVMDRNALVVRSGHPILARRGALDAQLLGYPWLVLAECTQWETVLRQRLRPTSAACSNNVIRTDSFYFFRTTLMASDCVGLTRYDAARIEKEHGNVIELTLKSSDGQRVSDAHMIGIVYRRDTALSAASQALIKQILDGVEPSQETREAVVRKRRPTSTRARPSRKRASSR